MGDGALEEVSLEEASCTQKQPPRCAAMPSIRYSLHQVFHTRGYILPKGRRDARGRNPIARRAAPLLLANMRHRRLFICIHTTDHLMFASGSVLTPPTDGEGHLAAQQQPPDGASLAYNNTPPDYIRAPSLPAQSQQERNAAEHQAKLSSMRKRLREGRRSSYGRATNLTASQGEPPYVFKPKRHTKKPPVDAPHLDPAHAQEHFLSVLRDVKQRLDTFHNVSTHAAAFGQRWPSCAVVRTLHVPSVPPCELTRSTHSITLAVHAQLLCGWGWALGPGGQ